ncbi:Metallo-dependent phosphatase-like protein [Collybia nuda]|uniref:Metallo-dependent phosphatase-like protein n=1 Tax=Collybia nuda TaxID=64659 RepID=A0A9P5YI69_9AGAR|nr:Metallo-dependent phosphatase-like protein [Collybia nuda]
MPTARQAFAFSVISLFIFFSLSDAIIENANTIRAAIANRRYPDFSYYQNLRTLSVDEFPLGDSKRRVIVVGDVHGMIKPMRALLDKVSYDEATDVLIHVGDILSKGGHGGSMDVLSYMASNNITGVRGNHDQKVIEWRGWINWIRTLPGGQRWLKEKLEKYAEAEAEGVPLERWIKREKKYDKSKWWKLVPKDWVLFGEHYKIARAMTNAQYNYLVSLPLTLYIPSAHTYIVHAGLLPSDPNYPFNHRRQPLARVPNYPPATKSGPKKLKNETLPILRGLQELAILKDVPQNTIPWDILNIRSVLNGKVTNGYTRELNITKPMKDALPCYPSTIIYGHAASRGLDVKRWSIGLDSGCVYSRRLTALILTPKSHHKTLRVQDDNMDREDGRDPTTEANNSFPFGEMGRGTIVSVSCR